MTDRPETSSAPGPVWSFNFDYDRPTLQPSLRISWREGDAERVCHAIVTDGEIAYQADSTHALAGQTVLLPELEV